MAELLRSGLASLRGAAPVAALWLGALLAVPALLAQTGLPDATPLTSLTSPTQTTLADARELLAASEALGDRALTNTPAGVSPQDALARRVLLHRLVRTQEQLQSNAAELETLKSRKAELAREVQAWTRFAEPRPYSILLTDQLREEIQAEQTKINTGELALSMMDQVITDNRATASQAEEHIRKLNEQLESTAVPADASSLSWQRDLERLRSHTAVAGISLLESQHALRNEELATSRIRLALLQRQLVIADADTAFTQSDLDNVTTRIDRETRRFEDELSRAQQQRAQATAALEAAREELRRVQSQPGASVADKTRAEQQLELRQTQIECDDSAIQILRLMCEGGATERAMWELRFASHKSRNASDLRQAERRLEDFTRRLDLWRDYFRRKLEVSSSQIELQQTRLQSLPEGSDLVQFAHDRLAALEYRDALLLRMSRNLERIQRVCQRWAESIQSAQRDLPLTGRVQSLFYDTRNFVRNLWAFELFTAEDTITVEGQKITGKRSVTIGKIVMALLILVVGIYVSGLITRITEPIFIRRFKIETKQADLIRRWLRAFLICCLVLFSLVSVKIPLTVFAFAGGALAIGLGFGMQTLLKNFVSGLILLFERPFRIGDVLDVGGQRGTVTEIGLRSSVLQAYDGTEILIPNSTLLENNVTNWTYSTRKVRFSVTVGVAYGSDIRAVIQLMSEVADRHGLVEKDPKPMVLFTEFGDSALTFEIRYWIDVLKVNSAQVASDLRQMIAGAFAEHSIVMAFPQRDLHLDTARPLQVQLTPPPNSKA